MDDSGDESCAELRNPADALQILARSGETRQDKPLSPTSAGLTSVHDSEDTYRHRAHHSGRNPQTRSNQPASNTKLEHYELVQQGLLRLDLIRDLLEMFETHRTLCEIVVIANYLARFCRRYHPYCPIVPNSMLSISEDKCFHRADYLLLSIILTIASRDEPEHTVTHRHCWEHTQRLLLDVLLAQPWTQSPQTVRGLLLLAEWLPHVQSNHANTDEPDSLFAEGRTAWTMIGMAIRHAYLLRLDLAAFRKDNLRKEKHDTDQERLIWARKSIWR
jgi:hypothetical protein